CPGDYPDPAQTPPAGITGARAFLEYFPERDSLEYLVGDTLYEKPVDSGSWAIRASGLSDLYLDGVAAAYDPVHKVVVFGGGSNEGNVNLFWRTLDAAGTTTRIDDAPVGSYVSGWSLFAWDPGTARFLLIRPNDFVTPTGLLFYDLDL